MNRIPDPGASFSFPDEENKRKFKKNVIRLWLDVCELGIIGFHSNLEEFSPSVSISTRSIYTSTPYKFRKISQTDIIPPLKDMYDRHRDITQYKIPYTFNLRLIYLRLNFVQWRQRVISVEFRSACLNAAYNTDLLRRLRL